MEYQVLGPVAVLSNERNMQLPQQCQHLLAVLVLENGQPVSRQRLIQILWDDPDPIGRDARLTRIASELRQRLRAVAPEVPDPVPGTGDAYKLVMRPEQADVHRFRAKAAKAKTLADDAAIQMIGDALDEWTEGHGLYGRPLAGIPGTWAYSNREKLRMEHRSANLFRMERIAQNGGHEQVAEECRMLDDNADAMLDEKFVAMWMVTAYCTSGPDLPLWVFHRAEEHWTRSLGRPVSQPLAELARRIQEHDPELAGPRGVALTWLSNSATASAYPLTAITGQTKETTTVSEQEEHALFHNEHSYIGAQAKEFNQEVTINLGGLPQKRAPEQKEQSGPPKDDTSGQAS
ncbi:Bacterial transcriptional activator domain protein [Actinomadura rubteroloni]|uniref:Bacterial transcriptional activator domain protein n=1 Tax=Actinomadura rubteroloni TaxID=1926885 RepID=A0A2P4UMY0_9ACTN|nr:BTAD domain-containing putative transcriptional regulator [Actinomadura rubteroloni]POM26401.1 Bacterial transcriptional activator domain protein [Actinomadura rubteroloni]